MNHLWYENQAGPSNGYVQNQSWLTTHQQQDDQQNWDNVAVWNQGPYDNEPNGFDSFEYDGLPSPDKEVKEETGDIKYGSGYKALLRNEAHYFVEKDSRVRADLHEKKADGLVPGAPVSEEMKRYWVGRLFEAFKNTVDIKDKNCKNGKPAQSAQRLASNYYPDKEIEMICWQIFMSCSDSQYGVKLVEGHHHTKWESNEVHKTFEDRMEKIIEVCKSSKAMCKQLLDPPYYKRLVDAPGFEASLKENNKRINSERDVQNEIGRKAIKKGIDLTTLPDVKTEDEDGDEEEDAGNIAIFSPQAAKTPKNRRVLRAKHQSSSGKASSNRRASSAQSPVTPVSNGKRKQRSATAKNYKEDDDEEDEESDGSQYQYEEDETPTRSIPSKRAATKSSRAKVATPDKTSPSKTTSSRATPSHTRNTPSKPASKGASSSLPVRNQTTHEPGDQYRNHRSTLSSVVQVHKVKDEDRMRYKEIICNILQVDSAFAQSYSLEDLRFYARAYNNQFATDDWFLGTTDEATGRMFRVITESGIIHHFSQILPHFVPLAVTRGDLNPDKTVNNHSPHMIGFNTNGDVQKDMALGVLPNPFGLHNQLWNLGPQ